MVPLTSCALEEPTEAEFITISFSAGFSGLHSARSNPLMPKDFDGLRNLVSVLLSN